MKVPSIGEFCMPLAKTWASNYATSDVGRAALISALVNNNPQRELLAMVHDWMARTNQIEPIEQLPQHLKQEIWDVTKEWVGSKRLSKQQLVMVSKSIWVIQNLIQ
jgi:hypothetical protein